MPKLYVYFSHFLKSFRLPLLHVIISYENIIVDGQYFQLETKIMVNAKEDTVPQRMVQRYSEVGMW